MKLTRLERQMLWNQFQILSIIDTKTGHEYEKYKEILINGFEYEYDELLSIVYPDSETVPSEIGKEVLDILQMYRQIEYKTSKEVRDKYDGELFEGFDGNNEPKYYSFCCYYLDTIHRFDELQHYSRNSHTSTLQKYRTKLEVWRKFENKLNLSEVEAEKILAAT